jgi:hypothetical protein
MKHAAALAAVCWLVASDAHSVLDGSAMQSATASAPPGARQGEVLFSGMCDASGAVPLSDRSFLVADDEDNILRAYDVTRGGPPTARFEVSAVLGLPSSGNSRAQGPPEADIEAATGIGARAYFLTSHGRNSGGQLRPERFRFFATDMHEGGVVPVGKAYERLMDDLLAHPRLSRFGLGAAARLAPKARGGLNLEGMTARVEGGVWIGFRNPIPEGRAVLVPLLNPEEVIAGEVARLGDPVTLDLGGLGVRGLSFWHQQYLIIAGAFGDGGVSQLFTWDGRGQARLLRDVDLRGYNPEAFFTPENSGRILLLSDDGTSDIDGTECKRLKDTSKKRFRGLWLTLPT